MLPEKHATKYKYPSSLSEITAGPGLHWGHTGSCLQSRVALAEAVAHGDQDSMHVGLLSDEPGQNTELEAQANLVQNCHTCDRNKYIKPSTTNTRYS